MSTFETKACKFCGAIVAVDPEKHVAYHANPTCEGFRKVMEAEGARRGASTLATVIKVN